MSLGKKFRQIEDKMRKMLTKLLNKMKVKSEEDWYFIYV